MTSRWIYVLWMVAILAVTVFACVAVTQSQMTERVKYTNGYKQTVQMTSGVPVWTK